MSLRPYTPAFVPLSCLAIVLTAAPALAARKAPGCAEGRFAVTRGSEALGGPTLLVLHAGGLGVEGACPTSGKMTTGGRKGTRLTAKWERCGAHARVRLRAKAKDCGGLQGSVRGRGLRPTKVEAIASTCGDGVVDQGAGEDCDGAQGCADGDACAADCRCQRAEEPLDCETEHYPCAWSEVAADVAARSAAIAQAANDLLAAGGTLAGAEQAIRAESPAAIDVDDDAIRFRLPGGRPIWVLASETPVGAPIANAEAMRRAATASAAPLVVASGRFPKAAITLAPVAWLPNLATGPAEVAAVLSGVEDYAGNVVSLANISEDQREVDVSTFAQLAGFNVVYVKTSLRDVCPVPGPTGLRCHATMAVVGLPKNGPASRFDDNTPGVDYLAKNGAWFLGVSADFFRHAYPHGLDDVLVVLDASKSAGSDIARAMTGKRANVVGWDDPNEGKATYAVIVPFLAGLAAGRSTSDVYVSMGAGIRDVETAADLIIGTQDVRIRDLVRVYDRETLQPLTSGSLTTIRGYTDDDEPDRIVLPMDFWGVGAENAGAYVVHVSVDGTSYLADPLDQIATQTGDYRWHAEVEVDLGFDVHEKQPLEIVVTLDLPEGGTSVYAATPLATSPGFKPGKTWAGHFTRTFSDGYIRIDIVVDATFERDPSQDPKSLHPKFVLTGGTMLWTLHDEEGDGCVHTAPDTVTPLVADDGSYLKFDLEAEPPEYMGFARQEGELVELVRTCPGTGQDPVVSHTAAGGVWFQASGDRHLVVSGTSITGMSENAGPLLNVHTWSIDRVE